MKTIIPVIILLAGTIQPARADPGNGTFLRFAGSINEPSLLTNKLVGLGMQHKLIGLFDYQSEIGMFVDNSPDNKLTTAYADFQVGVSLIKSDFFIKIFVGPALVSATDNHLSTPYEFTEDLEVGLYDNRNVALSIGYKHFSNAGIVAPNIGRDFLFIKITLP